MHARLVRSSQQRHTVHTDKKRAEPRFFVLYLAASKPHKQLKRKNDLPGAVLVEKGAKKKKGDIGPTKMWQTDSSVAIHIYELKRTEHTRHQPS